MSNDQEQHETPPDFGHDDNSNKNDDLMFVSVTSPETVDVLLTGDDEDENPFGEPVTREKTPTTTTNTIETSVDNEKKLFQEEKPAHVDTNKNNIFKSEFSNDYPSPFSSTKKTSTAIVPEQQTPNSPQSPVKQEAFSFATDSATSVTEPIQSTPIYETQRSSSKPISASVLKEIYTEVKPVEKRSKDNIEIVVGDPTKVGEGMSSYVTYRITTKTTLAIFKKSEFSVSRRFSDFLGLHVKMINKHVHTGLIIPSPPEKDSLSMAKVKISRDEAIPTDFIDRRRALLERYLNRLAQHPKLIQDADVVEFLESSRDLPKSTNTQALSGAGVLRAFSTISSQVTKIGAKKSEQDQWFDEKHIFVEDLHKHFKNLYNQFNTLYANRKEAAQALKYFSASLDHLATAEEHGLLSSALVELANLEEKIDQTHNNQTLNEYSILTELVKEYISLLEMVQLSFSERIKIHQVWLNAEETLRKKRETKTKLEQSPKGADKIPQAEMEIRDWEGRVVRAKEDFENISVTIKQEIDVFEQTRMDDFQEAIRDYLNTLLDQESKILEFWEAYLPEAHKINL